MTATPEAPSSSRRRGPTYQLAKNPGESLQSLLSWATAPRHVALLRSARTLKRDTCGRRRVSKRHESDSAVSAASVAAAFSRRHETCRR